MNVEVVKTEDASFQGREGPVAGVRLTFEEGGTEKTAIGFGPWATKVLLWTAGDRYEIETFTKDGDDRLRFRLPQPAREQRGGFSAAYRNTREGQMFEQERMDRRTALMQAARDPNTGRVILDEAESNYAFLRKTAQ